MAKIVEFIPKAPAPLTSSGAGFVSDNGEVKVTLTTDTSTKANVMEFSRSGDASGVKWYPRAVLYVGENNMRDIIFNANYSVGASVNRQTHARYAGHFANIDDRFAIEAGQIKHYFSINTEQRAPLAFLKNPRLGFAGIIEIDPTWQIVGMGAPITEKIECIGALSVQDANGFERFQLPKVTAWDQAGNNTDGSFIVAPLGSGRYEVIMCVSDAWLAQDSLVYPVVVDPTVVVASAYTVGQYGGAKKECELSNGWIVCAVDDTTNTVTRLYVSKDNAQTWAQLCTVSGPINGADFFSIAAGPGTTVYLFSYDPQAYNVAFYSFDATTVANVNLTPKSSNFIPNLQGIGYGCSMVVDGTGKIWSVVSMNHTSYPSSNNISVGTSTDGGNTWTWTLLTNYNNSSQNFRYPVIVVNSNNIPNVFVQYYNGANYYIMSINYVAGTGWVTGTGATTVQSSTSSATLVCAAVGPDNKFHVAWQYGSPSSIQYANTSDGVAFSIIKTIYSGSYASQNADLAFDSNGVLYAIFANIDSAISTSYTQIRYSKSTDNGVTWSAPVSLTNSTTVNQTDPHFMWALFNENSNTALQYLWTTPTQVMSGYFSVNVAPNAPTLTAHAAFDATIAQTFGWTFSDPNTGDTPSAYQGQFVDISTGSTVLDTGKVASTSSVYTLAANTLANGKSYQWRITTWDAAGVQGPYSTYGTFNTSAPPVVTITSPATDGVTVGVNQVTVSWSESDPFGYPQGQYQVQLTDSTGNTVLSDTGVISDANARSRTVQYNLTSGTNYKVKVTVWNNQGIASAVVTRSFLANYTSPVAPVAIVLPQAASAYNLVTADFPGPDPTTTQPDLASLDVYRRNTGDTSWQRIAAAITLGAKITFTRASAANNPNTLKPLGVNAPAYVPGKWSQALSIWEGTTQLVFNSDFETITNTATVFNDPLTSYTGSTAAPWTVQSGSFNFGTSGATSGAVTSIIKAGNGAWKPLVGSGGQNLALTAQATFTQPSTLPVMNAHLTLEIDANNRYRVEINTTGTWLSLGKIVNGTYTDLTSQTITALSVSHAYTLTLALDTNGVLTAKLYDGTGTGGTLLQTLTATDTSLSGGFLVGVGGDTGVVISGASVTAPWADGWTIGGDSRVAWALTGASPISGLYSVSAVGVGSAVDAYIQTSSFLAVGGSTSYTGSFYANATNMGTVGSYFEIDWFSGSTFLSGNDSSKTTGTTSTNRINLTATSPGTATNCKVALHLGDVGTVTFDAIQLEAKSYATPYMRNDSTSASATRAAETATLPASVLNASAGTISVWAYEDGNTSGVHHLLDTTFVSGSRMSFFKSTSYYFMFNSVQYSAGSIASVGWHLYTLKWNGTNVTFYIDGIAKTSETLSSPVSFSGLTSIYVGCRLLSDDQWNSAIDDLAIWDIALTDAEVLADANATGPLTWQDGMTYLGHLDGGLYGVSTYSDYAVASGQAYDYKITANANNGVSADSAVANGSVTVPGLQVFDPTNPAGTAIIIPMDVAQTSTWTASGEKLLFAGRTRPVVEFGETDEFTIKVSVIMKNADGLWAKLNALVRSKTTLCFKTPDGRKIFGVVLSLPEVDQLWGGQTVDLTITETAYSEVV